MPEKPVLIIIGEAHPSNIENAMISRRKLRTLEKISGGMLMSVADRGTDYETTKASIVRINEEILKAEVKILKNEKISRLLLEAPANDEREKAYAEFREAHDLKRLKSRIRKDNQKMNARSREDAIKILSGLEMSQASKEGLSRFCELPDSSDVRPPMFALSHIDIAYKAGVFDIWNIDDENCHRQANALDFAGLILAFILGWKYINIYSGDKRLEGQKDEAFSRLKNEINDIQSTMINKKLSFSEERERRMHRNITRRYSPGSAVICGSAHVKPLCKLLSGKFRVKPFEVGQELLKDAYR